MAVVRHQAMVNGISRGQAGPLDPAQTTIRQPRFCMIVTLSDLACATAHQPAYARTLQPVQCLSADPWVSKSGGDCGSLQRHLDTRQLSV
jgi:hypothetical protein